MQHTEGEITMERARRFERPTLTLARLCSTPELRPRCQSGTGGFSVCRGRVQEENLGGGEGPVVNGLSLGCRNFVQLIFHSLRLEELRGLPMRSFVFCFTALCFTPTLDAKESEPTKTVKAPLAETLPFSRETTTEIEFSYIGLDSQPEVQIVTNRQNVSEFQGGILDVVKGDWNSDGEEDFAVLTASGLNGVGGVTANLSIYERY